MASRERAVRALRGKRSGKRLARLVELRIPPGGIVAT